MNNVFSTSKRHQPAMNSLYNACLPPDRWNTGQRCVCVRCSAMMWKWKPITTLLSAFHGSLFQWLLDTTTTALTDQLANANWWKNIKVWIHLKGKRLFHKNFKYVGQWSHVRSSCPAVVQLRTPSWTSVMDQLLPLSSACWTWGLCLRWSQLNTRYVCKCNKGGLFEYGAARLGLENHAFSVQEGDGKK